MKSLYVTSVERYSGKTATCLAIGKRLIAEGKKVGYIKPLSLQPYRIGSRIADEDAAFVIDVLGLKADPWTLSPIIITKEYLSDYIRGQSKDLMAEVKSSSEAAASGQDVLLLEGGASLREGYAVGLPTPRVAKTLGSHILVVVKYRDDVRILDDTLAAQTRLGDLLVGVILNRIPSGSLKYVDEIVIPFIESKGIRVFGSLPEERGLEALTVEEIVEVLDAKVLTEGTEMNALVEQLTVGAMTADAALSRFRKQTNKAVITGGDRTDIQLAALETSTTCLVLTGNLHPSPLIVKQAEEFGVAVLLVPTNTMETVEAIENVFGKTRLGQVTKLKQFESLIDKHVDVARLFSSIGLKD